MTTIWFDVNGIFLSHPCPKVTGPGRNRIARFAPVFRVVMYFAVTGIDALKPAPLLDYLITASSSLAEMMCCTHAQSHIWNKADGEPLRHIMVCHARLHTLSCRRAW